MIYLFITHQFMMGGVEKVFLNIASQLSDRKIYLLPTCKNYDTSLLSQLPSNVSLIENDRFKIDGVKSLGNLFLLALQVNKKFADISEDLCCVNFSDTFSTFLLSLLIKAGRHICWCHSNPRMVYKETRFYSFYKKLFCQFDAIVCLCETQKKEFCRLFGNKYEPRIQICYNMTDLESIDKVKQETVTYQKEYIVMVARFDTRSKDFYTLIDAYSNLDDDLKDSYTLVLVGDGPDLLATQQYTNHLGEQDNVYFAGLQANPYKWMKNASVFVLSSKWEGFGLVITEALACDCAVIASDCIAGPKDILANGKYGLLFDVGDEKTLKQHLISLLTDEQLRLGYKKQARERVIQMNQQSLASLQSILP